MLLLAALFISRRAKPQSTLLWEAVLSGNLDEAMLLVRAGADVNSLRVDDKNKESLLHLLAKRANCRKSTKLALLLLDYGVDTNAIDSKNNTVLHYAVQSGSLELVKKLLERGAKVDVRNNLDVEVLFDAAMNSQRRELLSLLLQYDVPDEETRNNRGVTALRYLVQRDYKNLDAVRTLLDLGLPVNQPDIETEWTALHYAILMDSLDLVKLMIRYGADVNQKSGSGVTPLCVASGRPHSAIARVLIENGASVHQCNDTDEQYPIHYACSHRLVENIRFLLQQGADINVTDETGATPFSMINTEKLTESRQVVIKHLAVLSEKRAFVNNEDLNTIHESPVVLKFYRQCVKEVQRMRETKVIGSTSFFSIVDKSFKELSFLARSDRFVKSFDESDGSDLFPLFFGEMEIALKNAVHYTSKLMPKEKALWESLSSILPELVLEKITYFFYMNEL